MPKDDRPNDTSQEKDICIEETTEDDREIDRKAGGVDPPARWAPDWLPALAGWLRALGETVRDLEERASRFVQEHYEEIKALQFCLEYYPGPQRAAIRRYARICYRHGWPPAMNFPSDYIFAIVAAERGGASQVEIEKHIRELWRSWYTRDRLAKMIEGWRRWPEIMEPRYSIILEALEAHERGLYSVAISALLTQIEGILICAFSCAGTVNQSAALSRAFKALVEGQTHQIFDNREVRKYFNEKTYARFYWGNPVPPLNRHAILHGADIDYGNKENSLRMFVAIDLVVKMLGWMCLGDGVYHRPGCPRLAEVLNDCSDFRVYYDINLAIEDGLQPCSDCDAGQEARSLDLPVEVEERGN